MEKQRPLGDLGAVLGRQNAKGTEHLECLNLVKRLVPLLKAVHAHLASLRRYKKNIKALYIVHPTMFIKTLLILFKPLIR